MANQDGSAATQAGSHPFSASATIDFDTLPELDSFGNPVPKGSVKDTVVELPAGFSGNPNAVPRCSQAAVGIAKGDNKTDCPDDTQIGVLTVDGGGGGLTFPVYNVKPPPDVPAEFVFNLDNVATPIIATVRTGSDYGVTLHISDISEYFAIFTTTLTIWGVPADHGHDGQRGECLFNGGECPSEAEPLPLLTNPTSCTSDPLATTLYADSWQEPGVFSSASFLTHENGSPDKTVSLIGCSRLTFDPSLSLVPDTTQADAPTGDQAFDLKLPQNESPSGLATAHLKDVTVTAPQGMTLNPGAADGLQGCSDDQFALHSGSLGNCPNASVVGTVKVTTPLLEDPLEGQVFVGSPECSPCSQADAQSGRLLRLFVQAQGSGVVIKAAGIATTNPVTGQLTVTFKELPQEPFSDLLLTLKGGNRAVFINPLTCGPATLNSSLTPWSGTPPASPSAFFDVDWNGAGGACPSTLPFSPSFSAGAIGSQAGSYSPLTVTFSRPDRNQILNAVSVRVPPGLLGMLSNVPRCGEPQAAQGSCPATSRIATATVASGTGAHPFWLSGPVYLTSGYKGAPFGLSIAIPAVAGPFNLGTIVTRAAINVDPHTAQVTISSDPFPQIIDGIKTHIQTVNVNVERPGFTFNPTSCAATSTTATIASTEGASAAVSSPSQAANCADLPFKPKLSASAGGRASKAGGASLDVKVAAKGGPQPGGGEANIRSVKVSLPKQLPSRLTTLQKACSDSVFEANPAACPAASNVGSATAATPVLAHALSGPAYLVSHGGAAFPDLEIVLQGEGVTLVLDGNTDIKKGITTSTFNSVPDAPISSFELKLPTGQYSVFTANLATAAKYDLCGKSLAMPTTITGQNGAIVKQTTKIAISGCPKAKKPAKKKVKKSAGTRRARDGKRRRA